MCVNYLLPSMAQLGYKCQLFINIIIHANTAMLISHMLKNGPRPHFICPQIEVLNMQLQWSLFKDKDI